MKILDDVVCFDILNNMASLFGIIVLYVETNTWFYNLYGKRLLYLFGHSKAIEHY